MNEVLIAIRRKREEMGYTQEYLASLIGMERAGYALIETGKRRLSVDRLFQIAEALNINVTELSGKTGPRIYDNATLQEPKTQYETNETKENALLRQRVEYLEMLLAEKERLIKVLEKKL